MLNRDEFNNRIASRLGDTNKVYTTNDEIDFIVDESLLTFGALSGYWKNIVLIETKLEQQIYNILEEVDVKDGYEHTNQSLIYQDIMNWLDNDFIGYEDIVDTNALIRIITDAINTFQSRTKLVLGKKVFNVQIGREVSLDADVLDVVAVYFKSVDGDYTSLSRTDEHNLGLINNNYISNINLSRPKYYSISNLSLGKLDLFPRPFEVGEVEIIYVKGKFGQQINGSDCLIPDNLVPYIKYKVAADLFSKETSKDPYRTAYCLQRWEEGITIGTNYAAIITAKLNDISKSLSSLEDFNKLRYGWRNDEEVNNTRKVNAIALAGYNLLAINRLPINTYSILLETISNAPIASEEIDVRDDYIPYILEYCLHLASIKDGIASIQKTLPALENFVRIALRHNVYLQNRKISYIDLLRKSKYPIYQARINEQEESVA